MKVLILTLLIAVVLSKNGRKGEGPMKDNAVAMKNGQVWVEAVKTHMASQRKFHTSEFKIYGSRREFLNKQDSAFEGEGSCFEKFRKIMNLRKEERNAEKTITAVTNANKAARNGPNAEKRAAWRTFMRTPRELAEEGAETKHEHPECTDDCCKAFYKYYNSRDESIKLQLLFHNKEFAEFDNEDNCVKEYNANVEGGKTLRDVVSAHKTCTKKGKLTKKEIKEAEEARYVGDENSNSAYMTFVDYACDNRGKRRSLLDIVKKH